MKHFHADFSHGLSGPQIAAEGSFSLGNRNAGSFFFPGNVDHVPGFIGDKPTKVKRDWGILHYSEFSYMQMSMWKLRNIFQFPSQDAFQARDELSLSFLCLGLAQNKNLEKYMMCNVSDL